MLVKRTAVLDWFLIVVVALLPFPWIVLMWLGPLALKPIHIIALTLVATIPILVPGKANWNIVFSGRSGIFIILLFLFFLVNFAAVAWAVNPTQALANVMRNGAYFFIFLVLTLAVSEVVREDRLISIAVPGLLIGAIGYLVYNYLLFAGLGYDYFSSMASSIYTGNFRRLRYWFPHRLFNCHLDGTCSSFSSDKALTTPLINTLSASFIIYIVLVGMFFQHVRRRIVRFLMIIAVILCCLFILISLSRSNLLALVLVLWFGGVLGRIRSVESFMFRQLIYFAVVVFALLLGTGVFIEDTLQETRGLLADRLSAATSDTRLEMFRNAIDGIAASPIVGHGTGAEVLDGSGQYLTVHNVFLASWYEQGFLGLALSIGWYTVLLAAVIKTYLSRASFPGNIAPQWVALLPTTALIRTQFSGGGELTIVDWVALSIFFGLIAGQRLSRLELRT